VGCDPLPPKRHGKEGVDGSSPSEGSAKAPETGAFLLGSTCGVINVPQVWSRSKPGGPFTRVDKGTYALTEAAGAAAEQATDEKPEAKPKPRSRKRRQETPAA
jgi:hypothetical protein